MEIILTGHDLRAKALMSGSPGKFELTSIIIGSRLGTKVVNWMEKVSDEQNQNKRD